MLKLKKKQKKNNRIKNITAKRKSHTSADVLLTLDSSQMKNELSLKENLLWVNLGGQI